MIPYIVDLYRTFVGRGQNRCVQHGDMILHVLVLELDLKPEGEKDSELCKRDCIHHSELQYLYAKRFKKRFQIELNEIKHSLK